LALSFCTFLQRAVHLLLSGFRLLPGRVFHRSASRSTDTPSASAYIDDMLSESETALVEQALRRSEAQSLQLWYLM
jgi:hypothetical protein